MPVICLWTNFVKVDLGYEGTPFTWTNNQIFSETIQERLNRYLVTSSWKSVFRDARVSHLDYYGSDHRKILLDISKPNQHDGRILMKPFQFEPLWQSDSIFKQFME